jgi:Na+/H+ antiporter NhaD/arsenite permease-like protein
MTTQILILNKKSLQYVSAIFKSDPVFALSFLLALISCVFSSPRIQYVNFEVLACLFNLMIVVKAFEELRLLDSFAVGIINRCTDSRRVSLVMVLLSFFASMIITNDIALLTLVPLTLIINRKTGMNVLTTVILQTLAANIGSSLTPVGNPQNLYIFSYYKLTAVQFFVPVALFTSLGLAWLFLLNLRNPSFELAVDLELVEVKDKKLTAVWTLLFAFIILSVFKVVSYQFVLLLTIILTICINRELFRKVDYFLLATFVCFFIFIGNISNIPFIADFMSTSLNSGARTYFGSIILSQVISNVPCAVLLSQFTSHWKELLLGVSIGGMGTIIASLASVISYKLYIKEKSESGGEYLVRFSAYNFLSLAVFTAVNYIFLIQR